MTDINIFKVSTDLKNIMPGYINNRNKDIALLTEALSKCDFQVITVIGHKMKGTAAAYGLPPLSVIGTEIETAGKTQNADAGGACLLKLKKFMETLKVEFDENA